MVGYASRHRWGCVNALCPLGESDVRTTVVVNHEMECHRVSVVLNLLREGISQPSKAPRLHPKREVLPLDKRRTDVLGVGIAHDRFAVGARANGRTVATSRAMIRRVI